jgi:hypothetical protein
MRVSTVLVAVCLWTRWDVEAIAKRMKDWTVPLTAPVRCVSCGFLEALCRVLKARSRAHGIGHTLPKRLVLNILIESSSSLVPEWKFVLQLQLIRSL